MIRWPWEITVFMKKKRRSTLTIFVFFLFGIKNEWTKNGTKKLQRRNVKVCCVLFFLKREVNWITACYYVCTFFILSFIHSFSFAEKEQQSNFFCTYPPTQSSQYSIFALGTTLQTMHNKRYFLPIFLD